MIILYKSIQIFQLAPLKKANATLLIAVNVNDVNMYVNDFSINDKR